MTVTAIRKDPRALTMTIDAEFDASPERVSKHPEDVRTLVAHEPPLASILPDREHAMAATRAVHETYQRSGWAPRWRSSSPSADIRDRSPRRSPASRRPTRRCSACRPRTTARAPTRCSARTSSPALTTSPAKLREVLGLP
jgi:hypothetical protein